jgi:hypothetical protein
MVDTKAEGKLNLAQFTMAMLLISKAKAGNFILPNTISEQQWNTVTVSSSPASITTSISTIQPTTNPLHISTDPTTEIPVTEKTQYESYFDKLDPMKTGFVTGQDSVAFFKKSGLAEMVLAQIWYMTSFRF